MSTGRAILIVGGVIAAVLLFGILLVMMEYWEAERAAEREAELLVDLIEDSFRGDVTPEQIQELMRP